jgi:hypothetical protein
MVKICFAPQLATIYYPEKNTRRINVETGDWKKPDSRVWLGDYYVEKELVIN